ncbi:alginate export family protein [Microbulbifer marinus]|uniref:Alginate export n=1 Tax=Microbulbifer marinus TaxID=658218 RepID=A0A1H3VKS8_9GAMM|nr:alginate export family protein [Microbulbifer marinus]SDZ75375.1 Alginate export [Microbulbifer marinus]
MDYRRNCLTRGRSMALTGTLPVLSVFCFCQPAWSDHATATDLNDAIMHSCADVDFRYRYERVDQENFSKNANASTLRSRLTWHTATLHNWVGLVEVDNIAAIGSERYNSTVNGKTQYPVVADPTDTDLNRIQVQYKTKPFTGTLGRQRINQDNQRFVGGVGWRQNEQTFDGGRAEFSMGYYAKGWRGDVAWIGNVNRVFGPDGPNADLRGTVIPVRLPYTPVENHELVPYLYWFDFDSGRNNSNGENFSTGTLGLHYHGSCPRGQRSFAWDWWLSAAIQKDIENNPKDYTERYFLAESNVKFEHFSFGGGYEYLGGTGKAAFITPLATLHKFQGWADQFLNTPVDGVGDAYVKGGFKWGSFNFGLIYHNFRSTTGGLDYGNETDAVAEFKVNRWLKLQAKYADYRADEFSQDTEKFWFSILINPSAPK